MNTGPNRRRMRENSIGGRAAVLLRIPHAQLPGAIHARDSPGIIDLPHPHLDQAGAEFAGGNVARAVLVQWA
jgi:hypothetical protein